MKAATRPARLGAATENIGGAGTIKNGPVEQIAQAVGCREGRPECVEELADFITASDLTIISNGVIALRHSSEQGQAKLQTAAFTVIEDIVTAQTDRERQIYNAIPIRWGQPALES